MSENIKKLNSQDYLPAGAYRRNHEMYELVCYVNCLIGCRISANAEGESVFQSRIKRYMDQHPPTAKNQKYYGLVSSLIAGVADER
jgi:hypothetical protein